jgi:hypothetical protein
MAPKRSTGRSGAHRLGVSHRPGGSRGNVGAASDVTAQGFLCGPCWNAGFFMGIAAVGAVWYVFK